MYNVMWVYTSGFWQRSSPPPAALPKGHPGSGLCAASVCHTVASPWCTDPSSASPTQKTRMLVITRRPVSCTLAGEDHSSRLRLHLTAHLFEREDLFLGSGNTQNLQERGFWLYLGTKNKTKTLSHSLKWITHVMLDNCTDRVVIVCVPDFPLQVVSCMTSMMPEAGLIGSS